MKNSSNRNKKQDIVCIWKEFPYLGDVRDSSVLDIFANYKMYENEIRLMAQMRVILMSSQSYPDIKPYLEAIKENDETVYNFVSQATQHYINAVKPKYKDTKTKLEHYTESIRFSMLHNKNISEETNIYPSR